MISIMFSHIFILCIFKSTSLAFDVVNEENIYICTGKPQRNDIANIVNWMLNEDYKTAYQSILLRRKFLYSIQNYFTVIFCKHDGELYVESNAISYFA